jgi:alkanesulfonate monooxygenase SsuD/methylene tetrahydromethanopterin reductase-like flavin-dependent oxidoreductase (luciferase family)
MTIHYGLFDNLQIDPSDQRMPQEVLAQRLDDLAYAEQLGMWGAFTAERHFWNVYRSVAPTAWVAAASQRTSRMRLGVLAYTLALHQPAQLAEEIAFLDALTNGRLEVGVGLGHRPKELEQTGIDPARRVPLFQERFAILQGLLSGASIRVESEFHTLHDVACGMLPVQVPFPPLWYAGTDPNAGTWAGANGLDLAIGFAPVSRLQPVVDAFRTARGVYEKTQAERDLPLAGGRIGFMRHLYLSDSDEAARSEMAEDLYRLNSIDPRVRDGSRPNRREEAEAEARRLIEQEVIIGGGPDEATAQLQDAQRQLGFDLFLGNVYPAGIEQERVHRTMRLLMQDVAPRVTRELVTVPGGQV